ncbi:hypothetical protein GCM10023063_49910 [Arthrobacter methylotrophus]|uniref:hypothetical protein n=1 Tax=Arthrobacter methylotrophus TaxID=121291 RepID=UPI0031EED698
MPPLAHPGPAIQDIGNVQFADMILEMDARTNFSEVLLARKARDAHELIAL